MSDDRARLRQTLTDVLDEVCTPTRVEAAEGSWDRELWDRLGGLGFLEVGVPEAAGGSGGDLADAAAVVRACGSFAAPVPVGDCLLVAPWLRAQVGLPHRSGPVAVVAGPELRARHGQSDWTVSGSVTAVPWAAVAQSLQVVAITQTGVIVAEVDASAAAVSPGTNAAGEPRDAVTLDLELPAASVRETGRNLLAELELRQALATSVLMAGALDRVLDLTRRYALEREQFGKPLSAFQSVKQQVALLAGEVVVAGAAVDAAVRATATNGPEAGLATLAARVRTARSATTAATIAHQVHGAMGFTREHRLQHFSRRLWAWRDEHGTEGQWQQRLGALVHEQGADHLWPSVTR